MFLLNVLSNILWFVLVGLISGMLWCLFGLLWCITIVGIPVGIQCFKMAGLTLFPFGRKVVYGDSLFSFLVNTLWLLLCGWELALYYVICGLICCVTIVGIPAGLQCFKFAKLALMPFGTSVL